METWFGDNWWWFVILAVWSFVWKGFALWTAAKKDDKVWFVALMILNTVGIIEIFYLFFFSKRAKKSQ
jgi:methionyl-tRNA synthetase